MSITHLRGLSVRSKRRFSGVAHRDVAQIRGASSLFSLREWPDEVTKGFWRLLRELARERQPIRSFVRGGQPVEAAFYRQAWSTLKAEEAMVGQTRTLPIDENLARRVDGLEGMRAIRSVTTTFRNFIRAAESILGFIDIDIDTDSLTQTFPVPDSRPAPVEPEPSRRAIVRRKRLRRLNPSRRRPRRARA